MLTFITVVDDTDEALKTVRPVNRILCIVEQAKPHSPKVSAALAVFCSHLPSNVAEMAVQLAETLEALE